MEALGIKVIEVIIGLIFIYLLLSILVSLINEIIVANLSLRSKFLKRAIIRMLDDGKDKTLSTKFYNHPLIKKLKPKKFIVFRWFSKHQHNLPSYISEDTFTKVLIDVLNDGEKTTIQNIRESIEKLPDHNETKYALISLLNDSEDKIDHFKQNIASWFNESMDRLSGIYKRYNQYFIFTIGFVLTIMFNVDTIYITKELTDDKNTRAQIASMAISFIEEEKDKELNRLLKSTNYVTDSLSNKIEPTNDKIDFFNAKTDSLKKIFRENVNTQIKPYANLMGIGWEGKITQPHQLCEEISNQISMVKIIGWLLTALAVSLGAPFWFDMLNKLINFRGHIKRK